MADWLPTRHTAPLSDLSKPENSRGHKLIKMVERYWKMPDGTPLVLDEWQKWLLIAILEVYPQDHPKAGQLRYRQVLVSMGRQNGKSVLGAILGLYGLLQHARGSTVVGLASSVEQANIIYDRAKYAVDNSKALSAKLKASGTRGIKHKDGSGSYIVKPAKADALQGIPIPVGLVDELHILPETLWDAVVNGQRAQADAIVVGITTAGDDTSELLKRLYKDADSAVENPESRFGAFVWEAPEGAPLDDVDAIKAANPSIAEGRVDIENALSDVKNSPEHDVRRFLHNRFVASINPWIAMSHWYACRGAGITEKKDLTFSVDVTPKWQYGTIAAARKTESGIETEVIATLNNPSPDYLQALCEALRASYGPSTFVMDRYVLGDLAKTLQKKGYRVEVVSSQGQNVQIANYFYRQIVSREISHKSDWILTRQMPGAKTKNVGDSWRLVKGTTEIDAVQATMYACYFAAVKKKQEVQIF